MSTIKSRDEVAEVLAEVFTSADLHDSSHNPANVVDAVYYGFEALARSINRLGNADASTPMGGLEALGKCVLDSADRLASSLDNVADAIRESR